MEEKDNIVDVESEVIEEKKVDNTGNSNQNDQSNTILFSILSYIGILWLIPLLVEKNDKVVRFHVNQGIVLFIFDIIGSIAVVFYQLFLSLYQLLVFWELLLLPYLVFYVLY